MLYQAYANRSLVLFRGEKVSVSVSAFILYFLCVFSGFLSIFFFKFLVGLLPR